MSRSSGKNERGSVRAIDCAWRAGSARRFWGQHREASLNWLALGLLLAAWNVADNGVAKEPRQRPPSLRGYSYVSVRAATRMPSTN